jgi:hypothetical protein
MSGELAKNMPVDPSFIPHQSILVTGNHSVAPKQVHMTFSHRSAYIADRSNVTDTDKYNGSELPEFSDVKMFVDSLLVSYQTRVDIGFELERTAMIYTPYRRDFIKGKT